jgi:hypothetical protein
MRDAQEINSSYYKVLLKGSFLGCTHFSVENCAGLHYNTMLGKEGGRGSSVNNCLGGSPPKQALPPSLPSIVCVYACVVCVLLCVYMCHSVPVSVRIIECVYVSVRIIECVYVSVRMCVCVCG